jgi:hypothetical protein
MKLGFRLARAEETATKSRRWRKGIQLIRLTSAVLWVLAVSIGLSILWSYENAPGVGAAAPSRWPHSSRLQRAPGSATLVMLAHPHCPCTRASIGELARLMAQSQGRLTAYVLFLKPAGFSDDWEKTDLWQSARSIPGVSALIDDNGTEARLFHAATSGQTMLYDVEGRLLFSGGITGSRGHAGDNAGRSAIVSLVNTGEAVRTETFVFGCQLFDENSECQGSIDERNKH